MEFEWDEDKNRSNIIKHGIDVVHTDKDGKIRLISARKASKLERKLYERRSI